MDGHTDFLVMITELPGHACKSYIKVAEIIMPGVKSIGQFYVALITNTLYGRTDLNVEKLHL